MALKNRLREEYAQEIQLTDRVLERLKALPLEWRPHKKSRSVGELVSHVADIPVWGLYILDAVRFDIAMQPPPSPVADHDDTLRRFLRQAQATFHLLDKSDAELQAVWWLKHEGGALYSMPRTTAFRRFVLNHLVHHRGQLSVYVRMNDAAVPCIYGETADESWATYTLSTLVTVTTSTTGSGGG